jgi:hypothetical protein
MDRGWWLKVVLIECADSTFAAEQQRLASTNGHDMSAERRAGGGKVAKEKVSSSDAERCPKCK